ncbi:MAG: pyrroline-5-carboxylate reductase [Alphaproteobacteria bacterium]
MADLKAPRGQILLLGAGRMGGALLKGWLETPDLSGSHVFTVVDPAPAPWIAERAAAGDLVLMDALADRPSSAPDPALVLLAVKPQAMAEAAAPLAPLAVRGVPMVSIAAGLSTASLRAVLGAGAPVIRVMPNTPMAIGRGVSVAVADDAVSSQARDLCSALMAAGGPVFWIEDESAMDAVTAVSGSGPAYVFHLAECLAEAGIAAGLEPDLARSLARLTVAGSGALLWPDEADPAALREAVTSPGGTTAAALSVLQAAVGKDAGALQDLMARAVAAAAARARALDGGAA